MVYYNQVKGKERRDSMKDIDDMIPDEVATVINRQIASCDWHEGHPIEVFQQDGYTCVRYVSGNWWHYDPEKGTWW